MAFGKKRRLTPQELARLCSYATPMGRCPYARVTLTRDGARFASPYCKAHCCKKIDNNAACQHLRTNNRGYCQQRTINGQRCNNYIKSYDPKEFKFCSQYRCANARTHQNDTDLRYCPDHRCAHGDCASPRAPGGSSHCASHTCASPACLAVCPGAAGDPHDPSRFCDRHRMCSTANCRRFAYVRDDGVPLAHCGAHYCKWEAEGGCGGERAPDALDGTCAAHVCAEPGCLRARNHKTEGSHWCKDHGCTVRDCRWRRWLGEFCPEHQCGRPGCERRGEHNRYCDRHRACSVAGCERYRMVDGENVRQNCEEHSVVRCRKEHCDAPVVDNTPYCENHLCTLRPCVHERAQFGTGLCNEHRCNVPGCPHRRTHINMANIHAFFGGAGGAELPWMVSGYCNGHACRHEQCHGMAAENSRYCREHARCRQPGCVQVVDANGQDPTCCAEHNRLGPGGTGRRGVLGDPFGFGGGGWPGVGAWGVNAAI